MSRSLEEILMPGGRPLGVKGSGKRASATIREVPGGYAEAETMFQELALGGNDITPSGYQGQLVELPDGRGVIGLRPGSKSGPPTIDLQVTDTTGRPIPIRKIKFVG